MAKEIKDEIGIDRTELREVVRSEIDRSAILKAVELAEKERNGISWQDALRHPATLTVLAFFLTAVVGVLVERMLNRSAVERAERDALVAAVTAVEKSELATVDELTELISRRWVASNLFRSALKDGDKEVIIRRFEKYQTAYEEWNTRKPTLELRLRENLLNNNAIIAPSRSFVEREIALAIESNFSAIYSCLYSVYRQYYRTNYSPNLQIDNTDCIRVEADRKLDWFEPAWRRLSNVQGCKGQVAVQLRRAIRFKRLKALGDLPDDFEEEKFKQDYEDFITSQCTDHANMQFIKENTR